MEVYLFLNRFNNKLESNQIIKNHFLLELVDKGLSQVIFLIFNI